MECTSHIPISHSSDLNLNSGGFSWHLFCSNTNYGEENGCKIPSQKLYMEHFSSHDKDLLRQIMQNQDTMFRHQVQELHRLYRKQRELMDEVRVKNVFPPGLSSLSRPRSDTSHATSTVQRCCNDFKFPFPSFESNGNRNMSFDLDPRAAICCNDERIRFRERNLSQCKRPENVAEIAPETVDLSSFDPNERKYHFFIDLNLPVEAAPQSALTNDPGLHNRGSKSDGRDSSAVIDLNSIPFGCFPEAEMNPEHISTAEKETPLEHPVAEAAVVKVKPSSNLNANVIPIEPSTPSRSPTARTGDGLIQGPVSPENEEGCPPRGKCKSRECTRMKRTPPLFETEREECPTKLDTNAAETLVEILSSRGARDRLSWFAEVISAAGVNLDSEIAKIENDMGRADRTRGGGLFWVFESKDNRKGHGGVKRMREHQDSSGEISPPESKEVWEIGGCHETRLSRRRAKSRRCSSERVKKSMRAILKQPTAPGVSKPGDLGSWGRIKRREGGVRRRASKFALMS